MRRRDYSRHAPDDLTAFAALLTLPDGVNVCAIIVGWFVGLRRRGLT
jgi:hypothetical protein